MRKKYKKKEKRNFLDIEHLIREVLIMSVRNKQNWIKTVLSKSGTELSPVNEDKSKGWFFKPFSECRSIFFVNFLL